MGGADRSVRSAVAALVLLAAATAGDAGAGASMPVALYQAGPKSVRVEIAGGRVGPCDSSYNVPLFSGWVDAGQTVHVKSPYGCVCYRHTYDDFPQVNWSPSTVTCRRSCAVYGGWGRCPADPDDAIWIQIKSSPI
jgi:hypothetical protein